MGWQWAGDEEDLVSSRFSRSEVPSGAFCTNWEQLSFVLHPRDMEATVLLGTFNTTERQQKMKLLPSPQRISGAQPE